MGVGTGVGSMSTTTDVIYTHKKFKRAAAEAWESKESKKNAEEETQQHSELPQVLPTTTNGHSSTNSNLGTPPVSSTLNFNGYSLEKITHAVPYKDGTKLECTLCGFVSSKQALFEQHVCMHSRQNYLRPTKTIPGPTHHHRRGSVEASINKFHPPEMPSQVSEATRVSFNRSHSLPFGVSSYKDVEEHYPERGSDGGSSCPSSSKHIYKPKFRGQYSFQESIPHCQAAPNSLSLSKSSKGGHDESIPFTPHVSSASFTYQSSTAPSPTPMSNPGLLQTVAPIGKPVQAPPLEGRNSKLNEFSPLSKVTSQYSSIWKGIKSPSPDLVEQHITNLIVQNQAIVETHNPLWSMKYRRQSSIGPPLTDSEGGTSQKTRKISDASRGSKSHSIALGNSSPEVTFTEVHGDANSSSLSSLPRSYFYTHPQSSLPARASKNISNPPIPTSSHLSKVKTADVYNQGLILHHDAFNSSPSVVKNQNYVFIPEAPSESLDLSKSPKLRNNSSSSHCNEYTTGNESQGLNLKYGHQAHFYSHRKPSPEPVQIMESKKYEEQEVALDLHKRPSIDFERSSSRGSSASEPGYSNSKQPGEDAIAVRGLSVSPSHFQPSPPLKRQRLSSSSDMFTSERVSYSPVFTHNGKAASKSDYRMTTLDEYGKPKGNSHHMYGGEVQICDGKETKTLKIDSIKSDTPSLHLCIASKHLGVDLESKESQPPTSVVVTIAKCGLNSGGTMVKVENQSSSSYTSRKVGYNSASGQNTAISSSGKPLHHEKVSVMPPTSTSFHPSLIHYSQLPSIDVRGVSPSNLSNVSLQLLKGPVQASSLPPNLNCSPFDSQNSVRNPGDVPLIGQRDPEPVSLPKAVVPPLYPSVISIGGEVIPHVPGMPGPYSQAGIVFKSPAAKLIEPLPAVISTPETITKGMRVIHASLYPPTSGGFSSPPVSTVLTYSSINAHPSSANIASLDRNRSKDYSFDSPFSSPKVLIKTPPVNNLVLKPPEIRIQPPPQDHVFSKANAEEEQGKMESESEVRDDVTDDRKIFLMPRKRPNSLIIKQDHISPKTKAEEEAGKTKSENEAKVESTDDGKTFLMPRKRPNTLIIKPQSPSVNKSSLSLIGSTLVSPDTPRPKKSCAQLFLNGSAYTYLNLKVSTKTFFCCIYRPQPMYGLQSTNPKLSMYSNWQICKTENPLNISPSEAMSLHISGQEYNRAYTIAKPKTLQLISTDSSYWTKKKETVANSSAKQTPAPNNKDATASPLQKKEADESSVEVSVEPRGSREKVESTKKERKESEGVCSGSNPKRIKIFEGGFKTNEDYTYVRGRGRGRYVCETCGIRCKKPSMLKKHIRTHTDLRPFACKHCSFSFKTKGNLTKHLKSKAHFKRCTEMGIIPVPVTVNESHVNQEALQLQGILERGKGVSQNMDDDDDDEEEEDEEEEEDDDEEDEDEEEDEDDDDDSLEKSKGDLRVTTSSSPSRTSEEILRTSPFEARSPKGHSESLSTDYAGQKQPSRSRTPGLIDGSMPMDLSLKRPSVITASSQPDEQPSTPSTSSSRENHLRPSHLPLVKRLSLDATRSPSASTPIKEQPEDILSPVTDSSMMLKCIYSTTRKVASSSLEKRTSGSDHIKGDSCGAAMLQTYLTERAVLDSARKRHQYLQNLSEDQSSSGGARNTLTLTMTNTAAPTSYSLKGASLQDLKNPCIEDTRGSQKIESSSSTGSLVPLQPPQKPSVGPELRSSASPADKKSVSESVQSPPISLSTSSVSQVTPPCHPSHAPVSDVSLSSASSLSTKPKPPPLTTSGKVVNPLPVSLTGVSHGLSSAGSTIITSPRTTGSNAIPSTEVRLGSGRKGSKSTYSAHAASSLNTSNPMPTPPANLTVLNSCSGDSKTAFIAPSGVIPSPHNNRMGSDDGKCKCSVCHKEFAKQGQLRLHINIHYIERPHRCDSCGISFRTNGHLQKHKRSVSHYNKVNMNMTFGTPSTNNPRPFKCHDCKSAFRIYGHLAKHLRSKLHIMKLECLGKLPFGTYAEIERSGVNLNEIDTSDCENSLESLQLMASKLYEKEPAKLLAWQSQQQQQQKHLSEGRERTVSSSSTNSEEYTMLDEQESGAPSNASTSKSNEDDSGEEDDPMETKSPNEISSSSSSSSSPVSSHPPYEVGSGATEGLYGCPKCHQKFLDIKNFEIHHYTEHENPCSKEGQGDSSKGKIDVAPHAQLSNSSSDPTVTHL